MPRNEDLEFSKEKGNPKGEKQKEQEGLISKINFLQDLKNS